MENDLIHEQLCQLCRVEVELRMLSVCDTTTLRIQDIDHLHRSRWFICLLLSVFLSDPSSEAVQAEHRQERGGLLRDVFQALRLVLHVQPLSLIHI